MRLFIKLYNSIHLNLGVKRAIFYMSRHVNRYFNNMLFTVYGKFNRLIYKQTIYHYGADYRWGDQLSQNIDKKTFNYGYGYIHYSLVRNQKPKNILCIGSMYGFIPFMLARACMENKIGHVDFVDASYDMHEEKDAGRHIFGQGFWNKPETKEHFTYLLDKNYITLHVMTTQSFANKYPFKKYDYIYMDGDHRYEGAKFDFKTFWPRLNERGYISLHDIYFEATAGGIKFEQWKLWEELVKTHKHIIELYNGYSGLGIIQKMSKRPSRMRKNFDI